MHQSGIPLRTIVHVGNHPMVEIVEHELAENVRSLPSFIQDTTYFLNKLSTINQPLPNNWLMSCMDVKALYPSVPRKEAREAAEKPLEKRSNKDIPTDEVLRMMDMVIENSNFSLNGKHYVQTEGTAIVSHLGMNYASVYLGSWEKHCLKIQRQNP